MASVWDRPKEHALRACPRSNRRDAQALAPVAGAGLNPLAPVAVGQIPIDRGGQALLKIVAGLPAQFAADAGRVDGVAAVMAGSVAYPGDQAAVGSRRRPPLAHDAVVPDQPPAAARPPRHGEGRPRGFQVSELTRCRIKPGRSRAKEKEMVGTLARGIMTSAEDVVKKTFNTNPASSANNKFKTLQMHTINYLIYDIATLYIIENFLSI